LTAERAQRLAAFARACKAAARVVALYPPTHPTIQASLERIRASAERLRESGVATLTILPDNILLENRAAQKPDASINELAVLLHEHSIGEVMLAGELTSTAWHTFLTLLARPPEDIREQGGIAQAWTTAGGGPLEIRQIDYEEVLRDRSSGVGLDWERLVANYLEGELADLDDEALNALFDIAGDLNRFKDFTSQLVSQAGESGAAGAVLRVMQALANFVAREHPDQLDRILDQIAAVVPQLTPDLVMTLITTDPTPKESTGAEQTGVDLSSEVRDRIHDTTVAELVANSVVRDHGATQRLAQAFQALVPDPARRSDVLEMARRELDDMPISRHPGFDNLWQTAEKLLRSYSDASYVAEDYAEELSTARSHAIEVERVSDDPPERVSTWLATVNETEIRRLDQQLLLDLLRIETREDAWPKVLETAADHIEHLVLTGNIAYAQEILDAIKAAGTEGQPFAAAAREAIERLRGGTLTKQVVVFIRHSQDTDLAAVSSFCRSLGPEVLGPLVESLASEENSATIRRLRDVVLAFGAAGRAYANQLRRSPNPAVRRAAIELLRVAGGREALSELAHLLEDAEPAVQRDAVRAIVHVGTDQAFAILHDALKSGTPRTRDAMIQVLATTRDERAAPLFAYILEHTPPNGALESVRLMAIDGLGKVGRDPKSVEALRAVLYERSWWAPWRSARLRDAAARALRTAGSELATQALEQAANTGPRSIRRAARAALALPAPDPSARRAS
jgi:hypothetical protein